MELCRYTKLINSVLIGFLGNEFCFQNISFVVQGTQFIDKEKEKKKKHVFFFMFTPVMSCLGDDSQMKIFDKIKINSLPYLFFKFVIFLVLGINMKKKKHAEIFHMY